eukprot:TRINITY_DN7384_c0_g1_i1.p1 TRINITY_DN7384_c0_g1~~TRINITY_DN7384_c0_g1_i1.p1  ORF type:complete len:768 (+),score=344.57 TRINITY_DN7384_c0_g1_i1:158-2305(+)
MSAKQEEKNLKIIRELMQQPDNKKCADCGTKGPVYISSTFGSYICTPCSGLHREFNFRVKSISMGVFKVEEVKFLQENGNRIVNQKYLAKYSSRDCPEPDPSNLDQVRNFIKQKYVDKRWFSQGDSSSSSSSSSFSSNSSASSSSFPAPPRSAHHQKIPDLNSAPKVEPLSNILGGNIPPIVVGGSSARSQQAPQATFSQAASHSFFDDEPTPQPQKQQQQQSNTPFGNFGNSSSPFDAFGSSSAPPVKSSSPFDAFGSSSVAPPSSNSFDPFAVSSGFSSSVPVSNTKPQQNNSQNIFDAFGSSPPKSNLNANNGSINAFSAPSPNSNSNIFDVLGSSTSSVGGNNNSTQAAQSSRPRVPSSSSSVFDAFGDFSISGGSNPSTNSNTNSGFNAFDVKPTTPAPSAAGNPFDFGSTPASPPKPSIQQSSPFDSFGSITTTTTNSSPFDSSPTKPQSNNSFDFSSDFGSSLSVPNQQTRRPSLNANQNAFGNDFSFGSSNAEPKKPSPVPSTSGLFDGFSPSSTSPPPTQLHQNQPASSPFSGFDSLGGFGSQPQQQQQQNQSFGNPYGLPQGNSSGSSLPQLGGFNNNAHSSPFGGNQFGGAPNANLNGGGYGGMDGGAFFLTPQEPNPLFSEQKPIAVEQPKTNPNAFASLVSFGASKPAVKQSEPMGAKPAENLFGNPSEGNMFGISQASHMPTATPPPQNQANNDENPFGFF